MLQKAAKMGWRFSPHLLASFGPLLLASPLKERVLGSRLFDCQKKALILLSGLNLAGMVDTTHIKDSGTSYI